MTKKIVKKKLKRKEEQTEMETTSKIDVEKISKILYYSGYCLTDIYNFAEFNVTEKPIVSEDIKIKEFKFDKEQLEYTLGNKITKINIRNDNAFFDNEKSKKINKIYLEYFKSKYPKCEFYWIDNFNKKEKNYDMVGIVLEEELKGLLKLN